MQSRGKDAPSPIFASHAAGTVDVVAVNMAVPQLKRRNGRREGEDDNFVSCSTTQLRLQGMDYSSSACAADTDLLAMAFLGAEGLSLHIPAPVGSVF